MKLNGTSIFIIAMLLILVATAILPVFYGF